MKARKLPSGNWRAEVLDYIDEQGKHHNKSFTAPTKKQAELKAMEFKVSRDGIGKGETGSVGTLVDRYIEVKAGVLSPQTVVGYKKIVRTCIAGEKIEHIRLADLSPAKAQEWVSHLAKRLSPKSVKNAWGLVSAAMEMFCPGKTVRVKLPQAVPAQLHTPTTEEVERVINYAYLNDEELYRAIVLAATGGFRRGEICALTAADVDREKHTISVTKAVVHGEDGEEVTKAPKTASSVREVSIPEWVCSILPASGRLVPLSPNVLTNRFCRAVEKCGVQSFRFHDLRHYYASTAIASGVDPATAKALGGWSRSNTMERVYVEAMADGREEKVSKLFKALDGLRGVSSS